MVEQGSQVPGLQLPAGIPLGRTLLPDELAEFKAKGREWSRIYKEKRRKEFSAEQVEERKMKNRLRQKRFRERQKSREQEESARLQASIHQQQLPPEAQQHVGVDQQPPHSYDPNTGLQYADPMHGQPKPNDRPQPGMAMEPQGQGPPQQETLVEKRKRLGRERQARFREKKRMRSQHAGVGEMTDGGQTAMEGHSGPHHEVQTIAELQKMSAQLSGYYLGLTQGLSQEEHQAVMRFFLDNVREELGDEVFLPAYQFDPTAAAAAAAQAQYMVAGQHGLDLHALHQAAAAHMPPADMQAHMAAHGAPPDGSHLPPQHMQTHMEQMTAPPEHVQHGGAELTSAQLEYHRQLAEHAQHAQQAGLAAGQHQEQGYEQQGQAEPGVPGEQQHRPPEGHPPHMAGPEHGQQQDMGMYGQPGVPQEMLQQGGDLHYVTPSTEQS